MNVLPILVAAPTPRELSAVAPAATRLGCLSVVTGVGPGAAALALARCLEREGPHVVLLAGLAGAYREASLRPGACCLATSEVYGDLGRCGPGGFEPIRLSGEEIPTLFPLEEKWRPMFSVEDVSGLGLACGPMVSLSCVSGTPERARRLHARLTGMAENMEGAAAAQVCAAFDVPLLEIRGISNIAGDLDPRRWHVDKALAGVERAVTKALEILLLGGSKAVSRRAAR